VLEYLEIVMSQQIVFDLLKELNAPSKIDDIFDLTKKKNIQSAKDRVKIRDSLILLERKGYVKHSGDEWIILIEFPDKH